MFHAMQTCRKHSYFKIWELSQKRVQMRQKQLFTTAKINSQEECQRVPQACGVCPRFSYMDLNCKVAVVTGGASGIGFAISNELLCNGAYKVIMTGCDPEIGAKALEKLECLHGDGKACYVPMDVRKDGDFEFILSVLSERFGGIDILVNNAGLMNDLFWEYEVDVNVNSVVRGTLMGLDTMRKPKKYTGGVILNIASILSFEHTPYFPIFTATQYAIAGFTKAIGAKEHFTESGIRIIGLCPSWTDTSLLNCSVGKAIKDEWGKEGSAQFKKNMQTPLPVGKGAAYMLKYAPTGTLWVVENDILYKTEIPDRKTFSNKITFT